MIKRFLSENFLVAMPMGLTRNTSKGGLSKGPIMKPDLTSFAIRLFTTSGSACADWRLLQIHFWESVHSAPGLNPWLRPDKR